MKGELQVKDFSVGVVFLTNQRAKLISGIEQLVGEFQLQQVNDKWGCLMFEGQSIEEPAVREQMLALSSSLPLLYYTLEESGFAYRIFNCGEEIAAYAVGLTPFEAGTLQLNRTNPAAFCLFDLGNEDVLKLMQLLTPENLADENGLNNLILTSKAVLQFQGLSWKNGRCIAGNEVHPITVIQGTGARRGETFTERKTDTSIIGKPGFFKMLLLIWRYPRQVTRYVVETDYSKWSTLLMLFGMFFTAGIMQLIMPSFEAVYVPVWLKILMVLVITVVSLIPYYIVTALLKWTGTWLGGKARYKEIRAAYVWGGIPYWVLMIIASSVQVPIFYRSVLFLDMIDGYDMFLPSAIRSFLWKLGLYLLITLAVMVFGIVIGSKSLSEVQGFSALRAFGNYIIALAIPFVIVMGISLIFTLLFTIRVGY